MACTADQNSTCPKHTLSFHFTHHTLNSLFPHTTHFARPLTYKLLLSTWFHFNSFLGAREKHLKKGPLRTLMCKASPWLTVSILFPFVPQSTNLSTVNNLFIHSLTSSSFHSIWKTSKNHEKKLKCLGISPQLLSVIPSLNVRQKYQGFLACQ